MNLYDILLHHLQMYVGLKDTALAWFRSYLSEISFSFVMEEFSSSPAPLTCGVPQESILGPLLFSVSMLSFGQTIRLHNIHF